MDNQELFYKKKYEKYKYKYKYIKLKNQPGGNTCKYELSDTRVSSYCDRIIYKSINNLINFKKYKVVSKNNFNLMQFSDHKMIYGIFEYNNKKYMIISWNMSAFDNKFDKLYNNYIIKKTTEFVNIFYKWNFDYLLFSFQESIKKSLFIKILIEILKKKNINLVEHKYSKPTFDYFINISKYYVQLLMFTKNTTTDIIKTGYHKFNINLSSFSYKQNLKNISGTKSYVYIKINDLTIISTHFPIDTKKPDYGNNLRLSAFNDINNKFIKDENLIIIGDLNFRKISESDQLDQLDNLLKIKDNFKEPGKLSEYTCKYKECKLKCNKESCFIIV